MFRISPILPILLVLLLLACGKKSVPTTNQKAKEKAANTQEDLRLQPINLAKASQLDGYVNVIPRPRVLIQNMGSFRMHKDLVIFYDSEEAKPAADYFNELMKKATGSKLKMKTYEAPAGKESGIYFGIAPLKNPGPEAYNLFSAPKYVKLTANQESGLFYAVQSLRQLMPAEFNSENPEMPEEWLMPAINIQDAPKFKWRGMLLDCSRHFMDKDFVKRYIDLLAFHKMNTLHWHITEDQGWRIAIDKYPKLTDVGAWREAKDGSKYGGFYSKEDIREIVAYAESRHVNIVPEIEMPGHSQAALAAYPEYSCTGGPFKVETEWGVFKEIYCAGNEQTFTFLTDVLDEVMELFPSPYIHIGADEVPKYRWEQCPKCQAKIEELGVEDEDDLSSWFLKRIADHLRQNGRTMIAWDEILEGDLPEGAIVQSWRGMEGASEAIRAGHQTIVSPTSHAYFDYDIKAIDLEKVYSFNPIPEDVTGRVSTQVLGGECNMWSERAPQEVVDSKVFPRLLAMSEVLWTPPKYQNYDHFYYRVQRHYDQLDAMGVDYGFETVPVKFDAKMQAGGHLLLNLIPGGENLDIEYSLGEDQETQTYEQEVELDQSAMITAQAIKEGKPYGEAVKLQFDRHLANARIPIIQHKYADAYTGGGSTALTNGLRGSDDFRDGNWQGYQFHDLDCTIDLGKEESVSEIESGYYQYNNSWIFLPTEISYSISTDGENFVPLKTITNDIPAKKRGRFTAAFAHSFEPRNARYIRVHAKNIQHCPDWHEASGSHAWLFIDEIIVK